MAHKTSATDAKSQIAAFRKTARELGCDETEVAFDKALGKLGKAKPAERAKSKKRADG